MGIIRGRIRQKEWTRYYNGIPVCGVGYRGFWTNNATFGGPSPFKQRADGTWYDPKTGEDCKVSTLNELLKELEDNEPKSD